MWGDPWGFDSPLEHFFEPLIANRKSTALLFSGVPPFSTAMSTTPSPSRTVTIVCRVLAIVLILPALVPLSLGVWGFNATMDYLATAQPTEATIVRNVESVSQSSVSRAMFTPVVSFSTPDGKTHKFEATVKTDTPAYEVGEKVAILYQPDEPKRWRFDSWETLWLFTITYLGIFGVAMVVAFGLWILAPRLIAWMQMNANR